MGDIVKFDSRERDPKVHSRVNDIGLKNLLGMELNADCTTTSSMHWRVDPSMATKVEGKPTGITPSW